ncbi:spermidine/putrescine transport system permease protein [Desulfitobacterium sp. LBE]|uniref:ABC transmembrane type-1 domain-containing protein n=5 Tax=root TaxID=1 RepID=Q24XJ1_DESHY|nr:MULTISPECIES: ABC transporter permease [Desulfitobacterium]ACL20608.1 binding-protein-dependent transport systems inner membrane component [Desulfitobacterium hafniense DCB-2]EHL08679.1 ABC transporter, permease protein [Desulfitobacterium hafniense DP7]KTE91354.1 ABC transporter permease [Desulfitobacterium hafniense]MEA5025513.1 ABC transporter permease [Desulfitobacterium hafniense]TWH56563.1 spermidine/putrescine transport system permease protein [Desulfitobacterium sp. LBE]
MKKKLLTAPYLLWMLIFTIVPLILVVYFSLFESGPEGIRFTAVHLERVFEPIYLKVILRSIWLALISTVFCLLLGYPMAMILASKGLKRRDFLIVLFVLPMWMNFLARTYAWMTLLENKGIINQLLAALSLPALNILYTDKAVILGMVYNFLPFMVLPIYSVLQKIDHSLIEAAEDLGATPYKTFFKVTFPLSLSGVASGIIMVFMPAVTTFVISRLLGGGQYMLIGNLIEQQFLTTGDWGFGSSLSLILMIFLLLTMGIMSKTDKDQEGGRFW